MCTQPKFSDITHLARFARKLKSFLVVLGGYFLFKKLSDSISRFGFKINEAKKDVSNKSVEKSKTFKNEEHEEINSVMYRFS